MFVEDDNSTFTGLSLLDLLVARDQFHVHLMKKENVVGTAVGRYLIRKTDPKPPAKAPDGPRPPRTLENSEVREYSWPCVLVFVSHWIDDSEFGKRSALGNFIPNTIYMPDGRSVPICAVLAPPVTVAPIATLEDDDHHDAFSGGMLIRATVQGITRQATLGCLVTDGHTIYGLTNQHVCGQPGLEIRDSKDKRIGASSDKRLGRSKFSDVYQGWPGSNAYLQMDVGLIELDDLHEWQAAVSGIGPLGPLADLSTNNISLKLIDTPVKAQGAVGGAWSGRIAALFYRFKSVAGFEYIADLLIGSSDTTPLQTLPGDSGTLIVLDSDDERYARAPIALQWGGAVFASEGGPRPFVLATNLSTICRDLEVDIYRGEDRATLEYWGPTGHYSVGGFACPLPSIALLRNLMLANRANIGFDSSGTLTSSTQFHALADVPDTVWKQPPRKSREGANHYADIDLPDTTGNTLDSLTPTETSLDPDTWKSFYDSIGWNGPSQRGLLPFRVWQIYKKMVEFVQAKDVTSFVAAAGILAHYVGDASQPLHGSMYDDGDPRRNPDGSPSATFLGHGHAYANGVHSAYESKMLDDNRASFQSKLVAVLPATHGMATIAGGQAAGFATIELMRRTRARINPLDIVTLYGNLVANGQTSQASAKLWSKFGALTVDCIVDSCRTLAMLWDSAWIEGNGNLIPAGSLVKVSEHDLAKLYNATTPEFLPSTLLNNIAGEL